MIRKKQVIKTAIIRRIKSSVKLSGVKKIKFNLNFFKVPERILYFFKRYKFFSIIFLLVIIGLTLYLFQYFLLSSKFKIKNVQIDGLSIVNEEQVFEKIGVIKGKNFFFVRPLTIEKKIYDVSNYIKFVKVEKQLPDKVKINIIEKKQQLLLINLSGAFVIDEDGKVVEIYKEFNGLPLTESDKYALMGYLFVGKSEQKEGDAKTDLIESNEEKQKEKISIEERIELQKKEKQEVITRIEKYWNENLPLSDNIFQKTSAVFSIEEKGYKINENIDPNILTMSKKIQDIELESKEIYKFVWESRYRFVIYLLYGKKIIFSTKRDINEQIKDLNILLKDFRLKGKQFKEIDVSSEVLLYE